MAPAPYDYTVKQPDAGTYFDAVRQGRADRLSVEQEQKQNALSRYLPDALQGDKQAQGMALQAAPVDQMPGLSQFFATKNAQELSRMKEAQALSASLAVKANTPELWSQAQEMYRQQFPDLPAPNVPFEQRELVIARSQTVADQLEQAYKEKMLANDTSRTTAQNAASYASAEASRVATSRGGKAPLGYTWGADGVSLVPIPGGPADRSTKPLPNRVQSEFETLGDQASQVRSTLGRFKDEYGSQGVGGVGGETALWLGRTVPALPGASSQHAVNWWQEYDRYKNVVRNQLFGAALTPSEQAAFEKSDINGNMDARTIRSNLLTQSRIINGALGRRTRAAGAQGYNVDAINELTGGFDEAAATPAPRPGIGRPGASRNQPVEERAGPAPTRPTMQPPATAIDHLRANPQLAPDFDRKYGPGSAARALGAQ